MRTYNVWLIHFLCLLLWTGTKIHISASVLTKFSWRCPQTPELVLPRPSPYQLDPYNPATYAAFATHIILLRHICFLNLVHAPAL